jgi:rubrerythrin
MVTEQEKTLEALQIAIRMEIDGKKYYQDASRSSGNSLGRKLFESLSEEEDIHRRKFEEIYRAIQSKKAWPDIKLGSGQGKALKTLFAEADENVVSTSSELEAVQTAMDMENKTFDYYQEQTKKASFDAEKKYYQELAGQERIHHALLLDYFEFLKNPAGWFTMKERHSLDGG